MSIEPEDSLSELVPAVSAAGLLRGTTPLGAVPARDRAAAELGGVDRLPAPAPGVVGLLAMAVLLPGLTVLAWALTGTLVLELPVFGLGALAVGVVARQRVRSDAAGECS